VGLVVLTGPSRGIGRACALGLARRGVDLLLVGRPSAAFSRVMQDCRALGAHVEALKVDLRYQQEVNAACEQLARLADAPLALVNNAAVIHRASLEELSADAWAEQLWVNLTVPALFSRAVVPAMREARRGRLIQVSSIAGTLGTAGATAYCASKWGLIGFTKALAEELSDSGVSTVAVLPGSVDTDMLAGSGFSPRMTAEDVAMTLVHHALDAPGAHNGAVIEMFGT
jgi:3-oxoacyl-[acyl-carrier protein] reductase